MMVEGWEDEAVVRLFVLGAVSAYLDPCVHVFCQLPVLLCIIVEYREEFALLFCLCLYFELYFGICLDEDVVEPWLAISLILAAVAIRSLVIILSFWSR